MTTATRDVEAAEGRLLAHDHIPHVVVDRLPLYTRALSRLASEGRFRISSGELGDLVDIHPEQIRRDLSYLGHLGRPGLGYDVRLLEAELRRVLGADKTWHTVLVGAGDLSMAILANDQFAASAFPIEAAFDAGRAPAALAVRGVPLYPLRALPGFLREHPVDVAVLAMPPSRAQAVADALVRGGVQAILNYAAVAIHVPERVLLRHIDAIAKLQEMTFYLNRKHDAVLARNEAALPRENLERGAMK